MNEKPAYPSDTADKVLVRMPDGMREQLKAAAKANNRTMNAEIVARLQATFDETIVTTVEARALLGEKEQRLDFNADEIADKVVERLEGRKRQSNPDKLIIVGNLGGRDLEGFGSYNLASYSILAKSSPSIVPRGNEPYGPKKSPNMKKLPLKKTKE